jgi:ElaB/YqjD/DUF883 family membrane-anchored ribosome-binding protein
LKKKVADMPQTARRYQKTAVNELKALLASSEDLLESLGDQSGEAVDKFRDRLEASVAKTKQRLGNSADTVASAAEEAANNAQSYVSRNPWAALAIGTVAGVAIGALVASGLGRRFR